MADDILAVDHVAMHDANLTHDLRCPDPGLGRVGRHTLDDIIEESAHRALLPLRSESLIAVLITVLLREVASVIAMVTQTGLVTVLAVDSFDDAVVPEHIPKQQLGLRHFLRSLEVVAWSSAPRRTNRRQVLLQ